MGEGLYYKHSGRVPIGGPAITIAGGAIVGSILALIYAYFDAASPFIYLNLIGAIAVGAIPAIVTGMLAVRTRLRNATIVTLAGAIVGFIALYVAWAAWPNAILGEKIGTDVRFAHLLASQVALGRTIGWINRNGAWRIGSTVETGFILWLAWAGEAAIIIGMPLFLAPTFIKGRVFC